MAKANEGPLFDHVYDDVKIVATLMAGAVGTISYGIDAAGNIYQLDEKGRPTKEVPESGAKEAARAALERASKRKFPRPEKGKPDYIRGDDAAIKKD